MQYNALPLMCLITNTTLDLELRFSARDKAYPNISCDWLQFSDIYFMRSKESQELLNYEREF